jgi:hypothetical protein
MDQFPLVRLPADDLSIYVRHARLGHATGLLRTSYMSGATLFLGTLYPDADPTPPVLLDYLAMKPQDARSWYYARLLEAHRDARHDPDKHELERTLGLEKLYWEQADDRWLDERIEAWLDRTSDQAAQGGHWFWRKPSRRYPAINWRNQHEVSVVRLLWVRSRPDMELLAGANLMRDMSCCTGRDWTSRCVNPNHFRLKNDLVPETFTYRLRGSGGRFTADGAPKSTVSWHANNARLEGDKFVVFHPLCDGTMGDAVQQAYNRNQQSGTGHCPTCYRAMREFQSHVPRVPRKALNTEARDAALWRELALAEFEAGGAQQVPPDDELYRPTPARDDEPDPNPNYVPPGGWPDPNQV